MQLSEVDLTNLDIFEAGTPFETFELLRREAPVFWHEEKNGPGFWAVTRYADLKHVSKNPQIYSSAERGALMRLGFSIAISIEPDILLLDEVLAVGDRGFKAKCFHKIDELSKNTAILLTSHSMQRIARVCTDIMVINHGKIIFHTEDISAGIDNYYALFDSEERSETGAQCLHTQRDYSHPYHCNSGRDCFFER